MAFFSNKTVQPPKNQEQAERALALLTNTAGRNRRTRMQKRVDFYYDKQEQYLEELITDQFKFPERLKLQKEFFNITEMIIEEIAFIYNEEPFREIQNGTAKDKEIYASIVESSELNQIMQQVNQFAKLCKTVAVRPVWRDERIQYDIFTPNIYDVFQDKRDTTKPVAFIWGNVIDLSNEISQNNDDKRGDRDPWNEAQNLFYYMDERTFILFSLSFDKAGNIKSSIVINEENLENVNPYGILPFVTIRDGVPVDQYFLEGGDGLINTNEIINIKLTELNYLTKMQSFSIPVRKGADDKSGTITMDPSMLIDLPADDEMSRNADFKFASPDAKIPEVSDTINDKIKKIALKYKLSPERFNTSGAKSSAEALQMRAWDQSKILKKDKPFYAAFEQRLFDNTRVIWNHHNPNDKISENATLFIDYKEIETPMTVEERDAHNILMNNNDLLSKKKWLMSENPDIKDEKAAQKMLDENKAERNAGIEDAFPMPIIPGTEPPEIEE